MGGIFFIRLIQRKTLNVISQIYHDYFIQNNFYNSIQQESKYECIACFLLIKVDDIENQLNISAYTAMITKLITHKWMIVNIYYFYFLDFY